MLKDQKELLFALNEHGVEYLVVGVKLSSHMVFQG